MTAKTKLGFLKKAMTALICISELIMSYNLCAMAYEKIEGTNVALTIDYKHNDLPVKDAYFSVYRTADISDNREYTLTDDFDDYRV